MDNLTITKTVISGGGAGESNNGKTWSVTVAMVKCIFINKHSILIQTALMVFKKNDAY